MQEEWFLLRAISSRVECVSSNFSPGNSARIAQSKLLRHLIQCNLISSVNVPRESVWAASRATDAVYVAIISRVPADKSDLTTRVHLISIRSSVRCYTRERVTNRAVTRFSLLCRFLFRTFLRQFAAHRATIGRVCTCVRICGYPAHRTSGLRRRDQFLNEAANGLGHRSQNLNPHAYTHFGLKRRHRRYLLHPIPLP